MILSKHRSLKPVRKRRKKGSKQNGHWGCKNKGNDMVYEDAPKFNNAEKRKPKFTSKPAKQFWTGKNFNKRNRK